MELQTLQIVSFAILVEAASVAAFTNLLLQILYFQTKMGQLNSAITATAYLISRI